MIQYAAANQRPAACRQLLRIGSDWEARYTPLHTSRRRAQHTITRFLFIDGSTTRAPRFLPAGSRTDAPGALPRADASSALPCTDASSALPRPGHAPIPLAPSLAFHGLLSCSLRSCSRTSLNTPAPTNKDPGLGTPNYTLGPVFPSN